jgi:tetratricopeptide (TPR) repeat protein
VSPSDFVSRGQALVAAGQYQEAVKVCRLGLLGRPTAVEGRVVLGQALLALRRYDEVLAEMRVALELEAGSAPAHVLKGEALLRKGDAFAAIEALTKAKQLAPGDPAAKALLAEAELARDGGTSKGSAGDGLGYVDLGDSMTKHYPSHQGAEGSGQSGSHTRPTSLEKRDAGKRTPADIARMSSSGALRVADRPTTPPPDVLQVGDRSGTVELDPEAEGVELDDDDFGEVADPPSIDEPLGPTNRAPRVTAPIDRPSARAVGGKRKPIKSVTMSLEESDVVELESGVVLEDDDTGPDDDDDFLDEIATREPSRKRPSVGMPAGRFPAPDVRARAAALEAANRPTAIGDAVSPDHRPPTLGPVPVARPEPMRPEPVMRPAPISQPPNNNRPGLPLPNAPRQPWAPGPPIGAAASLPTVAGAPRPAGVPPPPAASMPTMALSAAQQRSAAAIDNLFPDDPVAVGMPPVGPAPAWAKSTVVAPGAQNLPPRPSNPNALPPGAVTSRPVPAAMPEPGEYTGIVVDPGTSMNAPREDLSGSSRHYRTGIRAQKRLKIALWLALGAVVIGGGVFAGFQIRRIRLEKQIEAAMIAANNAARNDTWLGWVKARDGLAGIVQARDTASARARLARARAILAYDFGDDPAGAKQAVAALGPEGGGGDGAIARAYIALLAGDPAGAQPAAEAADSRAPGDAASRAVIGRAAMLSRRYESAINAFKAAVEKDPRPSYMVALAEAEAGRRKWDDAIATCDRALKLVTDHPAALIARARILARAGKLSDQTYGAEVTGQLDRVLAEGARPTEQQSLGVSPRQAIDATLALAEVQLARGDTQAAWAAIERAISARPDDQRFAEALIGQLLALGKFTQARSEAERALEKWPASVDARIGLAEAQLVDGDASAALETLGRAGNLDTMADALTLRGRARLAVGDLDNARIDLDGALTLAPDLVPAIVQRTWVDLRANESQQALQRIEPTFGANQTDPMVATVYAAALRQTGARDRAREVLVKITSGPEGPAVAAAYLELGRLERDLGDFKRAREAYERAIVGRGVDAKLEAALLFIDDNEPESGLETLNQLVGEAPNDSRVLLEAIRARNLNGDLKGARELLARVEKIDTAPKWQVARERGRLAIKASSFKAAADQLEAAIAANESDIESHLLLIDALTPLGDATRANAVLEPAKKRFGDKAERFLIMGKVAFVDGRIDEARRFFEDARKKLVANKAPPRRVAESLFGLGLCSGARGDIAAAEQFLLDGLALDRTNVDAWMALGDIAAAKPSRALDRYIKAARFNPEYADVHYQIGRTAFEVGDRKLAKDELQKYLDLAPNGDNVNDAKALLARIP